MSTTAIQLKIITPEKHISELTAVEVILPGSDGYLGILLNHAPITGLLDMGLIRYFDEDQKEQMVYIDGGFFHLFDNNLTVLTRSVISPYELTDAYTQEQKEMANRMPVTSPEEAKARLQALKRVEKLCTLLKIHDRD